MKNLNSRFILSALLFFLLISESSAQEFVFKGFKPLVENQTARIYKYKDVNGQYCAVLIIKHNFKDFEIESGKDIEYREEKTGETLLWLSPDEYRIIIRKKGYISYEFDLRNKLKSLETYELIISDNYGKLIIKSPTATIWLDNKIVGKDSCAMRLKEGEYKIMATKENYSKDERILKLIAGDSLIVVLNPIPLKADITIESEPNNSAGANILIDGKDIGQRTPAVVSLQLGDHKITLKKPNYIDASKLISIIKQDNYTFTIPMIKLNLDPQVKKHRILRNISLFSSVAFSGITLYGYNKTNELYKKYKTATVDAEEIRKQYELYKTISPIALSLSGITLSFSIFQSVKLHNTKKNLSLSFLSTPEYKTLALFYKF